MSLYPYCKTGVPHAKAYQLNYTRCKGFKLEQLSPFLVGAWRKYFPTTLWFSTSYYFIDWPHFSGESQPLYPMYKYHFYLEQFDFFHFFTRRFSRSPRNCLICLGRLWNFTVNVGHCQNTAALFVYRGISREDVGLDKRATSLVGLFETNTQVKRWKQTLRYRIVWNEKTSLTSKNNFCKEAIFSLG